MKAFLWNDIHTCSGSYHGGGSVLIEAESLEEARALAAYDWHDEDYKPIKKPMIGVDKEPDAVFISQSKEPKVWVFPDAGCC